MDNITKGVYVFEDEKSTGLHRCSTYWMVNVNNWEGKGDRLFQINNLHNVDRYTTLQEAFNNGNIEYIYKHVLNDLNISTGGELEKITEGGHTGWRLKGRDPDKYGNIGNDAVDFSASDYDSYYTTTYNYGALGRYAFAQGLNVVASGYNSHAEGCYTTANGFHSHAEGYNTRSAGEGSHTEGRYTRAGGQYSHVEGVGTIVNTYASHAEGLRTTANGFHSHAEGYGTRAQNSNMHVEGTYNIGTSPDTIHETGIGTYSQRKNAFEIYTDGTLTAPECTNTLIDARGNKALVTKEYVANMGGGGGSGELEKITENSNTGWRLKGRNPDNYGDIGNGAVDFSYSSTSSTTYGATGQYSFAQGYRTTTSGDNSHAEGRYTKASGDNCHAEGRFTEASGDNSHTEGIRTIASGYNSHAEGFRTNATGSYSHTEGYHTITQNSNMHAEGKFNIGTATDTIHETGIGTSNTDKKNAFEIYTDGTLTAPECTNTLIDARGNKALVTKEYVANMGGSELEKITENGNTGWRLKGRDSDNYGDIGDNAVDFSYSSTSSTTYGATGQYSFAEGYYTTASGYSSHTEGAYTTASRYASHAEGTYTTASASASHAEGAYTTASNYASHVEGKYNVGTSTDTIHETGIGTSITNRKNAFEIYTDGTLTAPECTNTLIDARGNKALVTKEFVNSTGSFEVLEETNLNTYTPDFNAMYRYFEYTLNQNSTVNNPLNVSKGEYGVIVIKEDNTGGWNVNWGTNYIFSSSVTLNTNPNAFNIFKYLVLDTDKILIEFVANF